MSAEKLHHAAGLLFSAYEQSQDETGEPIEFDDVEMDGPATLLYSYAMENAIKGYLVKMLNLRASDFTEIREATKDSSSGSARLLLKKWLALLC
jgi:hypothetical protein